jgi:hypothetical protein
MSTALRRPAVVTAQRVTRQLCDRLGLAHLPVSRPGAELVARAAQGRPWPHPGTLLRAADGWVHPGPSTVWPTFVAMAVSLGAPVPPGAPLPDLRDLPAEVVDAEAGHWLLPAAAVRAAAAPAASLAWSSRPLDVDGATVVVLGSAWAAPLAGMALARLGARVVRVENPRRPDPFPLRDALMAGCEAVSLDLDAPRDRSTFADLLTRADLLVDANTPRVLANLALDHGALRELNPALRVLRISALAREDRPGYGFVAESRGGWAARHDPPRLGRTSVADPVAGLLAAGVGAALVTAHGPGSRARVSLEDAVGLLLEQETT